jgi:hypothetical protein
MQGELQHRVVKAWNERSSKNNAVPQIVNMDMRESAHRRMEADLKALEKKPVPSEKGPEIAALIAGDHHHIAKEQSTATRIYIPDWLRKHHGDPALKV